MQTSAHQSSDGEEEAEHAKGAGTARQGLAPGSGVNDPAPGLEVFSPLGVVIPAFNAELAIVETLNDVTSYLQQASGAITSSVLVVDDGSTDHTAERVRRFAGVQAAPVGLLRTGTNRGKGHAVRTGVLAEVAAMRSRKAADDAAANRMQQAGWVLFMDADNSTPIRHLERFAEYAHGADVLIGTRRSAGARIIRQQHRLRQLLGKTFPYAVRLFCLPGLHDTQCGFKAFRLPIAERVFGHARVDRFAFDVEALLIAERFGAVIREVPVDWENPTQSTLRIARDAPRMLWDALASAWRWRRGGVAVRRLNAAANSEP